MTDLHVVDMGKGGDSIPVVFLHAFPMTHRMWAEQIALVSKRTRVIAYDVRGHGRSPVGDGQYTIEGHVDDLMALLDELKISRCVLAGLSMGGYIGLRALERNPERFHAAALCDTRSDIDSNETRLKRAAQIRGLQSSGLPSFIDGFLNAVLSEETRRSKPEVVALCREMVNANTPKGIIGTLLGLAARTDTTASLNKMNCPTLILVGQEDKITPPSSAEVLKQQIPNSELHILPTAGHLSNLENSSEFNHFLLDFLSRVGV